MKPYIFLASIFILFSSCEKAFLGENTANTPENNFELFWDDFDKHYGLFQARGWNWDSIYAAYRPQVTSQTTDEALWSIFSEMINYLDDSHTFINDPSKREYFVSGTAGNEQASREVNLPLVRSYLEGVKGIPGESAHYLYFYGKVKSKDIGYIYLNGIDLQEQDAMDDVLSEIGNHKAIILDLRHNGGGDDVIAEQIAGRFADREELAYTVQERNGPNHGDFGEKIPYSSKIIGKENFTKPVVILTDQVTISAADVLLVYMKLFPHVTQIGTTTAGDFSDIGMRRFLPNGWQYQYSIMMYLLPDGTSLDGIGHIPDIYVRNTEADILASEDKVLERAFQFLFEEYGIE